MTRDVLQTILRSAPGIQADKGVFTAAPEHKLSFYLGTEGRGITVNDVAQVRLEETFVTLTTRENEVVYAEYGGVFALSSRAPKENAPSKAGFA